MPDNPDEGHELSRETLISELRGLLQDMDEEGLLFLIKQANVIRYNKSVEEYNRKVHTLKAEKKPSMKEEKEKDFAIEVVEKNDGKHFFIVIKGYHIFFTREEMRKIVKICHAAENEADASVRLYNWFLRNRKDLLIDAEIGSAKNPHLAALYQNLIHTYRVRE